jgi:hypothetical protein
MNTDTSHLTLEGIMQEFYGKPCIRVSESWNTRFKRGSVLVYEDSVVIVANDDDTDLHMNRSSIPKLRFITPQREFGVLPGSHFFTKECYVTVHTNPNHVRKFRGFFRDLRNLPVRTGINTWGTSDKSGIIGLLNVRCPEEAGLWGRYDGKRLRMALAEGAD